ncbi:ABC transporter C family member 3-like protein [Tanacetum coccineum]
MVRSKFVSKQQSQQQVNLDDEGGDDLNIADDVTQEMDIKRYNKVLDACDLKKDLKVLSFGDQTVIGERGINLSGGQKQRIQIARAMYQDADIYLFDDPFSVVDAHTGSHIFRVAFLPDADLIVVLKDGRIAQVGTYDNILNSGTDIIELVGSEGTMKNKLKEETKSSQNGKKRQLVEVEEHGKDYLDQRPEAVKTGYYRCMAREDCTMPQLVDFKKEIFQDAYDFTLPINLTDIIELLAGEKLGTNVLTLFSRVVGHLSWELPIVNLQEEDWECGFYVMKWVLDFVLKYQHDDFPNIQPWGEKRSLSLGEMDDVVNAWFLLCRETD